MRSKGGGGSGGSSSSSRQQHGRGGNTAFSKLLILVLFSAGLIFAYVYLNSSGGTSARRSSLTTQTIPAGLETVQAEPAAGKQAAAGQTDAQAASKTAGPTVATAETIAEGDQRHPNNVQLVMSQQSHQDEHKETAADKASQLSLQDAKQGLGGEMSQGAKKQAGGGDGGGGVTAAAGTPGATNVAKVAAAGRKEQAGGGDGAAAAAASPEEHELGSGVKARAATLKHATEKLKQAAALLTKTAAAAAEAKAVVANATAAAAVAAVAAAASPAAKQAADAPAAGSPAAAAAASSPAAVASTASVSPPPDLLAYSKAQQQPGDTIHVLFTSNGSPYQNIQARVMVGTYHLVRKMPGGEKLVAMTRILHRTTPDEVMAEIPSFRADPLQPECDKWCWFPVADRANAVQQWIDAAHKDPSMVKAPWLLLLETDYVWVKPLLAKGSAYEPQVPGLAFRFDYIAPSNPIVEQILKEKCPECDAKTVPGSGPAPVLMRFSDLRAATPLWEDLSEWIETHEHAKKQLGWVREMYAWDIGVAANKLNILTQSSAETTLIAQPPHDHKRNNATMYHYTWGCIIKDKDEKEVWKFDKRFYTAAEDALKLPTFPEPPPWTEGLHVHDGTPWTQDLRDTMFEMISMMNAAVKTLPNLLAQASAKA